MRRPSGRRVRRPNAPTVYAMAPNAPTGATAMIIPTRRKNTAASRSNAPRSGAPAPPRPPRARREEPRGQPLERAEERRAGGPRRAERGAEQHREEHDLEDLPFGERAD